MTPKLTSSLTLAAFALIAGIQFLGPVPVGLANNGDFVRVLGPLSLWPAPPYRDDPRDQFRYFIDRYVVAAPVDDTGVPSSELLVAAVAKNIAAVILPAGAFNLRIMGLIHAAILALALFILLKALGKSPPWLRLAAGILLVLIWADVEYVQQFSTAYTDAGAVMALAVLFSVMVYRLMIGDSPALPIAFALFGCFLLATKTQHETALPFLAAFCILAGVRALRRSMRILWCAVPVLLAGTSAWLLLNTPQDYRTAPAFTIVFYKLAVLSPDPKSVLADFHMPESEFLKYVGHYAYEGGVPINDPAFRRRLLSLVNPSSLWSFYWRHPRVTQKVLLSDLRLWASDVDLHYSGYGNLRPQDALRGRRPFTLTLWSRARHSLFNVAPYHLIWLFGAVIVLAPLLRFPLWEVTLLSTLLAISSFLFASLLDAVETARHLVFFQVATDFTIFSIILAILLTVLPSRDCKGAVRSRVQQAFKRKTSSS